MKVHYLIDGYNLLFRLAKSSSTLKKKRVELIEKLNELVSSLSLHATIIFDGAEPHSTLPSREHFDAIEIVYTTIGLSADAFILEKIESATRPQQFTVVTNDRSLALSSRAHKAKTLSVEKFLAFLIKKRKKHRKKTSIARPLRDTDTEISRLLQIFEKRLDTKE